MMDLQGWSSLIMTVVCMQVTQCCLIQPRPRPPVDGGWSEWEEGTCSVTCGGGIRIDNRECNNPEPKNGGEPCSGNKTQTFECNTNTCPGGGAICTLKGKGQRCGGQEQPLTKNGADDISKWIFQKLKEYGFYCYQYYRNDERNHLQFAYYAVVPKELKDPLEIKTFIIANFDPYIEEEKFEKIPKRCKELFKKPQGNSHSEPPLLEKMLDVVFLANFFESPPLNYFLYTTNSPCANRPANRLSCQPQIIEFAKELRELRKGKDSLEVGFYQWFNPKGDTCKDVRDLWCRKMKALRKEDAYKVLTPEDVTFTLFGPEATKAECEPDVSYPVDC